MKRNARMALTCAPGKSSVRDLFGQSGLMMTIVLPSGIRAAMKSIAARLGK